MNHDMNGMDDSRWEDQRDEDMRNTWNVENKLRWGELCDGILKEFLKQTGQEVKYYNGETTHMDALILSEKAGYRGNNLALIVGYSLHAKEVGLENRLEWDEWVQKENALALLVQETKVKMEQGKQPLKIKKTVASAREKDIALAERASLSSQEELQKILDSEQQNLQRRTDEQRRKILIRNSDSRERQRIRNQELEEWDALGKRQEKHEEAPVEKKIEEEETFRPSPVFIVPEEIEIEEREVEFPPVPLLDTPPMVESREKVNRRDVQEMLSVGVIVDRKMDALRLHRDELLQKIIPFERKREIGEVTKKNYETDIRRCKKNIGENPSAAGALKWAIETARWQTAHDYGHAVAGIREGFSEIYKEIEPVLPHLQEREEMKFNLRQSQKDGLEIQREIKESYPKVKPRIEELDPLVLEQIIENMPRISQDAINMVDLTSCRRTELRGLKMRQKGKGTSRGQIEIVYDAAKQRVGADTLKNVIVIDRKKTPEIFSMCAEILLRAKGESSLNACNCAAVMPFSDVSKRTLNRHFADARDKIGADKDLYKGPHSIRHQNVTDAVKLGMQGKEIARKITLQKDPKNEKLYGKRK